MIRKFIIFLMLGSFPGLLYAQQLIAAKSFGGNDLDHISHLRADSQGNKYVSGSFSPYLNIASDSVFPIGGVDISIFKLDQSNNVQWIKHFGMPNDYTYTSIDLAVDKNGNVITVLPMMGSDIPWENQLFQSDSIFWNDSSFCSSGNYYCDYFMLFKLNPSGNLIWAKKSFGGGPMAVDKSKNIYLADFFLDYDPDSVHLIDKLDSNGNLIWSKWDVNCSNSTPWIQSIQVVSNGNIMIAGMYYDPICLGDITLNSAGDFDNFIAMMDSDGNWLWVKSAGGAGQDHLNYAVVDKNGNVYILGDAPSTIYFDSVELPVTGSFVTYIAKYDFKGNVVWVKGFNNIQAFHDNIAIGKEESLLLLGSLYDPIDFGNGVYLTPNGDHDCFVAKFDSSGEAVWGANLGQGTADVSYDYAVACGDDKHVYAVGAFVNQLLIDTFNAYSSGLTDDFIVTIADTQIMTNTIKQPFKDSLSVFPNPAHEFFFVQVPSQNSAVGLIAVYDPLGRKFYGEIIELNGSSIRINLTDHPYGTYFIKLITREAIYFQKIVLQ